jgi:hypothetical protein
MAEIIENVKSNMVIRDENVVTATNLTVCVKSYLRQVDLSKTKDTTETKEIKLASALREVLHDESFFNQLAEAVADEETEE